MEKREIKVIYYGPPIVGKFTNIEYIQKWYCESKKIELEPLCRTGFLSINDCEFANDNTIESKNVIIQLPMYPQKFYKDPVRDNIIEGVKAFVYVVDSQKERMDANFEYLHQMENYIVKEGFNISNFPIVFQYNKRDLLKIMPIEILNSKLNRFNAPYFSSIAKNGIGIKETFSAVLKLLLF